MINANDCRERWKVKHRQHAPGCPGGCDAVLRVYGALHCPEASEECGGWYQPGRFIEHMQEKHNEQEK